MIYDCIIVGGGPAGLNAALVLGRARRKVALIDNNQPRNAVTHASHGFITRDGVTPAEFRRIAYEEVLRYPSVKHIQTEIILINKIDSGFAVHDSFGRHIEARRLILATGLKEVLPEIEGLRPLYGKSLFNCPYCDGWELRDQPLVVVCENPHVFHMAKMLLNWSKDLVICTNGKTFLSDEQKKSLEAKGVVVNEQTVSSFMGHDGQLQAVRFADGTEILRTGGFISPNLIQTASIVDHLTVERNDSGGFSTDGSGRTSIPGLYSAGDVSYFMPSQLVFAAADGSRTAMSVNMDLTEEEFELF
ncbi:NAD(P)/FAD-dependent oxidoreductase [Paenibacillus odorifer]|uniref:NAD(P)/FAD-dependent oxidoreductase n=1 Tax=Paenibacillus odorifer TaxID=189426 RepID=UPI00096F2A59|nr:NAD(P)/FAD-dependent oxidoreductase [Paenibacillus odorifer]OMD79244.1 pyridine nucleotide-disulfide oxidoreductase [Paenibacillus odorifer]